MKRKSTTSEDISLAKFLGEAMSIDAGYVVDWVSENFAPEDVYDVDELKQYIRENYAVDDVFDDDELEKWAENADYVRPHDDYPEREL